MPNETILVTGATGFAGGHLLDRLADRAPLVAWHRPTGRPPDPNRHIDWQPVNIADADDVARGIEESAPTQIFHVAGAPLVSSSFATVVPHLKTNVLGYAQHPRGRAPIGPRVPRAGRVLLADLPAVLTIR
jgi:nucleoside-diphosphate-sugar epimerase